MADLKNYTFYHGTSSYNASLIMKNKAFDMNKCKFGSLGKGAYAFANNVSNAKFLAWNKFHSKKTYCLCHNKCFNNKEERPQIISFKLKNPELVLDFTQPSVIESYNNFTNSPEGGKSITTSKYKYKNYFEDWHKNKKIIEPTKVKKLDGKVLEYFLIFIKKSLNKKFLGVYNLSQNNVSKNVVPFSLLPNSMELCVYNNIIIDKSSMHLL